MGWNTRVEFRSVAPSRFWWVYVWLACSVNACTSEEGGRRVAQWRVLRPPILQVGQVEGSPQYQFTTVAGSLVLDNGRIVVVDAGAREVRLFDTLGNFVGRIGRRGRGPGEFERLRAVYPFGGDTLAAYDEVGFRLSVFTADGTLLRTDYLDSVAADPVFRLDTWLWGRFWIAGAREPDRRLAVNAKLDHYALRDGEFRFAMVDHDDRVWVREPLDSVHAPQRWTVLGPESGLPIAMVTTPSGFELHQSYGDTIIGRWIDYETDVNFVHVYRVEQSPDSTDLPPWTSRTRSENSATTDTTAIQSAIQLLVVAQERYYLPNGKYASVVDNLDWEPPSQVGVHIVSAGPIGWAAAFVPVKGTVVCGISVGYAGPPGWPEGLLVCSPPPSAPNERARKPSG